MHCLKTTAFAILISGIAAPALSAATAANTTIITASKTAQIADKTLAPVIVISRDEISRSRASDVADLLRFHAGLDIGRNGGAGQATSVFIRGTESNHTLVMIDGVKINPGTIGGAALQNISPDSIERIEIVKGPRSTLYGSEAIGGVINIITKQPEKTSFSFSAEGSRYQTQHASSSLGYVNKNIHAGIDLSYLNTDGFPAKSASIIDSGHNNTAFNAFLGGSIDDTDIELRHWQAQGNTEYLDFSLLPKDQDFLNTSTSITITTPIKDAWQAKAIVGYIRDELDQSQGNDFANTQRFTVDLQNDITLDERQLLTAGLYLSHERAKSLSFGTAFNETTNVNALYIQDDINVDEHHILASARYTDHETFGNHTTWNLEYGYALSSNTTLTAGAGTAFRAPDSSDRFGSSGNPNLDPETSLNLELGLRKKINKSQSLSIAIFDNKIKKLISYPGPLFQATNIDKATIRGVELAYQIAKQQWGTRISAITQNPEDSNTGILLPRRAEHTLTASAYYQIEQLKITGDAIATSQRKDSNFSTLINRGYVLLNLGLIRTINEKLEVFAKAENLLDKQYQLANGFNTADRSVFIGFKFMSDSIK